jgi:hypothetical protein
MNKPPQAAPLQWLTSSASSPERKICPPEAPSACFCVEGADESIWVLQPARANMNVVPMAAPTTFPFFPILLTNLVMIISVFFSYAPIA